MKKLKEASDAYCFVTYVEKNYPDKGPDHDPCNQVSKHAIIRSHLATQYR